MCTGQIRGVEALVRWNHPERGLLGPATFLPQIDGSPVSWELDDWIIRAALSQLAHWGANSLKTMVSVNISAANLQRPGFVQRLIDVLALHPTIDPGQLEFEIVESTAFKDVHAAGYVMEKCHALGVGFAVDDFGTGYSSLTYLRRLPATTLKIDQSFVRDMLRDANDLAIVQGVIGLASAFNRHVVAEGVETVEHGLKLLELGCELAQGFGIAPPMPAEEFLAWSLRWVPPPEWRAFRRVATHSPPPATV
jgi:EAL domain-containing protein (putative c-di-GMP-specific phosphodiesterase class I)